MNLLNKSILSLLFFSCFCSCQVRRSKHAALMYKVIREHSLEMNKKNNLKVLGTGGAMMDQIKEISLSYTFDRTNPDLPLARRLIVECASELLEKTNNDKELRPYLKYYPFNDTHIYLSISFNYLDKDNKSISTLDFVKVSRGKIIYSTYDHEKSRFVSLYEELYSDGLAIIDQEKEYECSL